MKSDSQQGELNAKLFDEFLVQLTKALKAEGYESGKPADAQSKESFKDLKGGNDHYDVSRFRLSLLLDQVHSLVSANNTMGEELKFFKRLFKNARDLIYRYELAPEPRFTYVSPSALEITGYTPEDHYADPFLGQKLVHPEDRHILESLAFDPNIIEEPVVIRWVRKDGETIWCEQRNVPVFSEDGKLIAIEGVARDITAIKLREIELNRKTENLTMLVEISSALSAAHDLKELMQKITDSAVKFLSNGTSAIYLIEKERLYFEAAHPQLPPDMPDEMRIAAVADHPHVEHTIETLQPVIIPDIKNASLSPAERSICEFRNIHTLIHLPLIYSNRVLGVLIIGSMGKVYHFTEDHLEFCRILALQASLKLVETRLVEEKLEHKAQMENEILERKKAEELVDFKHRFLANMSHEIRTPLTGILGVIDILSRFCKDEKQKEYIEILESTSHNLLEIVNQVLDYSKVQAGKLELKPTNFNFRKLTRSLIFFYQKICNENVEIVTRISDDIPDIIRADKVRISQIINNILNNAVKFTDTGSITFKAEVVQKCSPADKEINPQIEDLCIKVSIVDTGAGINKEKQAKLFQPFVQLDSSANWSYEGTGLGLSICKHLAQLHGGQIGVESVPGRGSNFWFTFVAQISASEKDLASLSGITKEKLSKNLRILLVEDKLINQKVISVLLSFLGHEITPANNGEEAVNTYQPGRFDLILMDIQMPVMDGITAVKILREKYKELPPIVGLSANAFEGDREKYIRLGMDEYLTKPLKRDDFEMVMGRLFNNELP